MIENLKETSVHAGHKVYLMIDGAQLDAPKLIYSHDDSP